MRDWALSRLKSPVCEFVIEVEGIAVCGDWYELEALQFVLLYGVNQLAVSGSQGSARKSMCPPSFIGFPAVSTNFTAARKSSSSTL